MSTIIDGSFTTAVTPVQFFLALPSGYTDFRMINTSRIASASAETYVMRAEGTSLMPAGSAYRTLKQAGAGGINSLETTIALRGFTFLDPSNPPIFARTAVTAVSAASPASVSSLAHGLSVGDTVRLTGLNGSMVPLSGLLFTVNSITNPNVFTITLDTSAAAVGQIGNVPATAGFVQKVISSRFSPHNIVVGPSSPSFVGNNLTLRLNTSPLFDQGASQYIPFLTPYQPGARLRLYMPPGFGEVSAFGGPANTNFIEIQVISVTTFGGGYAVPNLLTASILPGNPVGSITTAAGLPDLVYPAGLAGYTGQYPFVTDIAEQAGILSEAEDNTAAYGVLIGTDVQGNGTAGVADGGDTYQWFARKGYSI